MGGQFNYVLPLVRTMATTCGFGQIPDLRCKSLFCYGRIILDKKCNLFVANANIDHSLTVGVGGNVNFAGTTMNFTHSAINFTGSTITGLTLDLTGNLQVDHLVVLSNAIVQGHLYAGNITTNVIKGTLDGNVYGDLFGNITVNKITLKHGTLDIDGSVTANSFYGVLFGNSVGAHIGPVLTDHIIADPANADITVTGNLLGVFKGTVLITGNLLTDTIEEKQAGHGIFVTSNLTVTNLTVTNKFNGELGGTFVGNVLTSSIDSLTPLGHISIGSTASEVFILSPFVSFVTAVASELNVSFIQGNPPGSDINIAGNVITPDTVCANTIKTDKLIEKVAGDGIHVVGNLITNDIETSNIYVSKNLTIVGSINTDLANLVVANFVGNLVGDVLGNIRTYHIAGAHSGVDITMLSPVIMSSGLTCAGNANFSTVNVTTEVHGNVLGGFRGNAHIWDIRAARVDGNIDVYGNLVLHSRFVGDIVSPQTTTQSLILPNAGNNCVLFAGNGVGGTIQTSTNFTYNAITSVLNLPAGGSVTINGTPINVGTFAAGHVLFSNPSGALAVDTVGGFTYTATSQTLTSAYLKTTSIADTRVAFSENGLLAGTNALTFNYGTNTFTVNGTISATTITTTSVASTCVVYSASGTLGGDSDFTYNSVTGAVSVNGTIIVSGTGTVNVTSGYQVAGTQVVGAQLATVTGPTISTLSGPTYSGDQAAINTNFSNLQSTINTLIARMQSHGLIA